MTNLHRTFLVSCIGVLSITIASAKGPVFIEPPADNKDFQVQGEYVGSLTVDGDAVKIGVQVIALGNDTFRAVSFIGGLPGAGWNGEERLTTNGMRKGESVVFDGEHGEGEIRDGVFHVRAKDSDVKGELSKVTRQSPTLGKVPPPGAVVLFDGKNADAWTDGRIENGLLVQGCTSRELFADHHLHIEFRLPFQPEDSGQARGNSGLYLQGRYEVQMLDSFGLEGKDNECGGIYSVGPPSVNMCLPPLTWQTYDVDYTAARFADGVVVSSPRVTVLHNGVKIHDNLELPAGRSTTAAPVKPGAEPGPVYLQNHGNPVRYRNIWVVRK